MDKRVFFYHFDVKTHKKNGMLHAVGGKLIEKFLDQIGLFSLFTTKKALNFKTEMNIQRGIIRTNCIDSLDRTNYMQLMISLAVLERQLKVLNIFKLEDNSKPLLTSTDEVFIAFSKTLNKLGDEISM